jgi:hypothetical protein
MTADTATATFVAIVNEPGWLQKVFLPKLAADAEFCRAAFTFDGVIGLGVGRRSYAITVLAGEAVRVDRGSGLHGVKFGVNGAEDAWEKVFAAPRNLFLRQFHSGEVRVSGDLVEFLRLTEAVLVLIDVLRAAVREGQ